MGEHVRAEGIDSYAECISLIYGHQIFKSTRDPKNENKYEFRSVEK